MAQSTSKQASAQKRWANDAMSTQRKSEKAQTAVAPALSPNVSVGATKHNTTALRQNKVIYNVRGSSPASNANLGQSAH